jgi:type IV pilus assembly protein PilV
MLMMKIHRPMTNRRRLAGVSLIEVLVSILIFSFGIVGLIGLQARALQYSTSAEDTSRAALLANELSSTIILSQPNPRLPAIVIDAAAQAAWQLRVADTTNGGLPNGVGTVTPTPGVANTAEIKVEWTPPSAPVGATPNKYVTQVTVP